MKLYDLMEQGHLGSDHDVLVSPWNPATRMSKVIEYINSID